MPGKLENKRRGLQAHMPCVAGDTLHTAGCGDACVLETEVSQVYWECKAGKGEPPANGQASLPGAWAEYGCVDGKGGGFVKRISRMAGTASALAFVAAAGVTAYMAAAHVAKQKVAEYAAEEIVASISMEAAPETASTGSGGDAEASQGSNSAGATGNSEATGGSVGGGAAGEYMEGVDSEAAEDIQEIIEPYIGSQTVTDLMPYIESGDYDAVIEYAKEHMSEEDFAALMEIYGAYAESTTPTP